MTRRRASADASTRVSHAAVRGVATFQEVVVQSGFDPDQQIVFGERLLESAMSWLVGSDVPRTSRLSGQPNDPLLMVSDTISNSDGVGSIVLGAPRSSWVRATRGA